MHAPLPGADIVQRTDRDHFARTPKSFRTKLNATDEAAGFFAATRYRRNIKLFVVAGEGRSGGHDVGQSIPLGILAAPCGGPFRQLAVRRAKRPGCR
jgi:hypothetical protein